jgi:hypothetical protein
MNVQIPHKTGSMFKELSVNWLLLEWMGLINQLLQGLPILSRKLIQYAQRATALHVTLNKCTFDEVIGFSKWPNPSSRTMALGSVEPPIKMTTRNLPEGKGAVRLTTLPASVYRLSQLLTSLRVSMACYRDSFTLPLRYCMRGPGYTKNLQT